MKDVSSIVEVLVDFECESVFRAAPAMQRLLLLEHRYYSPIVQFENSFMFKDL